VARASRKIIKRIRALRMKKYRDETRTYFAEGISVVLCALENGVPVSTIVYSPDLLKSEVAYQAIARVQDRIPCYQMDSESFAAVSGRDNPVGMGAVIAYQDRDPKSLSVGLGDAYVALDGVRSPGNLGTIIRSADCLGFSGVLVTGQSTDQYHPECVKASMGALFSVPVVRFDSVNELLDWCKRQGLIVVTTSCRARDDIAEVRTYPRPLVLLMGSEGTGLSENVLQAGQLQVRITMRGSVSSLNLAVAAGILMYDIISKPVCTVGPA